ncbi:unnamed protein product [Paramecium sonneborni]|uniref:Cleavage and polyadenylation specificity factor n=1 Tax=Paramecium sonneborni TaxID=65129 RepID=A0A8S1PXD8_9CILI|nr:unnamed protein product [Paramecium sonneborni]
MNQDNSKLIITPLGAGNEVGRSCILLQYCEKQIMFDCGIHMNKENKGVMALPYFNKIDKIEDIDLILITHFHLDHCGALPYFLKNYKFKGKIYMTTPTKEIYGLVLKDSIKVKSEDFSQDLINEQSIEQSLKNIDCIDYDQEIYYQGIKLKCYNAGHVLGAAMFMVEIDGVRVLYTGDYSTEKERHLRPAQLPHEKIHVLIVEATYGDTQHETRTKREENFLREIVSTLNGGGNVLLPVFATGRCHELLIILDEYWSKNPQVQQFPIYSTCTLAIKCTHIFQKHFNKLGNKYHKGENLFKFNHINTKKHLQDILNNQKPKVVMASPGLLQSGHSKQIYEYWCKDEKNQVIITGPAVQGTIAHQLIHNPEPDIKIRPAQISFSAHADYLQTSSFIDSLRPQHVILVHGTQHKCRDLQKKIEINFKDIVDKVWAPENQKQVELSFQRSSVSQAGCKAIGELGNQIENFIITFQEKHNQHKIDEEIIESMTDCACCTNDLYFNGVLLNTEHGFMLVDETDKDTLQQYGIEQNQIYNQMYIPLQCSLEQVFNYVQELNPEAQFHPDDSLIVVKDLEIRVPVSSVLLQFKWISSPKTDDLADSLAFFLSNVNQNKLNDEELLKDKQKGLIQVLQKTEFQTEIIENKLLVKNKNSVLIQVDLNTLNLSAVAEETLENKNTIKRAQTIIESYLSSYL